MEQSNISKYLFIRVLILVFPFISGYTTLLGVLDLMDPGKPWYYQPLPYLAAVAPFVLAAGFYEVYFDNYPRVDHAARRKLWGPTVFFVIFLMSITTPFTVMSIGGDKAMKYNFDVAITEANQRLTGLTDKLYAQGRLSPMLGLNSAQFKGYAGEEERGGFTGVAGKGAATSTFSTIAATLDTLKNSVDTNQKDVEPLVVQIRDAIAGLRKLTYTPMEEQDRITKFATDLSVLNGLFAQLEAKSVTPLIEQSAGTLKQVAQLNVTSGATDLQRRQNTSMGHANELVADTERDLDAAARDLKVEQSEATEMVAVDIGTAIFAYAWQIKWAWALAIGLDFSPLLFLFAFAVIGDALRKPGASNSTK